MKTTTVQGDLKTCNTDLLAVPLFAKATLSGQAKTLDKALNGALTAVVKEEGLTGATGEVTVIRTHGQVAPKRIALVGMGEKKDVTLEIVRQASGHVAKAARKAQAKTVTLSYEAATDELDTADSAQAATEGFWLGQYAYTEYLGKDSRDKITAQAAKQLELHASTPAKARQLRKGMSTGVAYAEATMYTRDLVNAPAGNMQPKDIAAAARKLGKQPGVTVRVYTEAECRKLGMGSFLSVSAGSDQPAYFIHLKYTPKTAKKTVVLAGKGITFDSGGLSLKPSTHIDTMKLDMAGAASVLGVFSQITKLKPNVAVHGVVPTTENMPSGSATRPGDVVTAYNGKTIEIKNTDAEGRLILADALAWAEKTIKPDYMIDIATLTGAAMVSLGLDVGAIFATDNDLRTQIETASKHTGEQLWELPLVPEYNAQLKSQIADVCNIGKTPYGGVITAALFLQHFVEKTPWAHIDIAGPAWVESPTFSYTQLGGSGFPVRTLFTYLQSIK